MQPPDELRDQGRTAGWLNKLLAYARSCQVVEGIGYRINRSHRGTSLEILPGKGGGTAASVSRYRVESVENDHLVCKKVEGSSVSSETTLIAKPYNLRRTGWDGVAVTYTDEAYPDSPGNVTITYAYQSATYRIARVVTSAGSTNEHQVVTPHYLAGVSIIKAMEPENGTGVTDTTFEDINDSARAWARTA